MCQKLRAPILTRGGLYPVGRGLLQIMVGGKLILIIVLYNWNVNFVVQLECGLPRM